MEGFDSMTKPTKQAILDAIHQGMNVHEQARHFGATLWTLTKWRKFYGLNGVRRPQVQKMVTKEKRARVNHNRLAPVTFPQSDQYMAAVEAGLRRLQERNFPGYPFEVFRESLKSENGQKFLDLHAGQGRVRV
jgi:transposase-like protein